jgi:hypothetical protein
VRGDVDQVLAAEPMLVKEMRGDAEAIHRRALAKFLQVLGEQLPQTAESGLTFHVATHVV